jgi:hypothetical protein
MLGREAPRTLASLASLAIAACAVGQGNPTGPSEPPNLVGDGGGLCTDLRCRHVDCTSRGLPDTTLTGVVYDPAGKLPLYNVFAYVPNSKPDPIVAGHPACAACQAPASGSPIVWASSDAGGRFHITGVPAGDDVPLVLQLGKWRRQITVPHVEACQDTVIDDPQMVRLPSNASEGDMPRIALATGCDAVECFLLKLGIDPAEFTDPTGSGHVHVYGGRYPGMTIPGIGDAYSLWSSTDKLAQYDVVIASCECAVYQRDTEGPAYAVMRAYLDGGGRLYTTHFHFNWFAPPTGPGDFQAVADWLDDYAPQGYSNFYVDTTFPKGRALADWMLATHVSSDYGQMPLADTRDSVAGVRSATRWIYGAESAGSTPYDTKYLSFNTPLAATPAQQCGRATFSDVHVAGLSTAPGIFPDECSSMEGDHGGNEDALEFLFFDLVSCIQDDSQNPQGPPLK